MNRQRQLVRRQKKVTALALITTLALVSMLGSCSSHPTPTPTPSPTGQLTSAGEFDVIREAADAYMNSGKPLYITAKQLHDTMMAAGTAVTPDFKLEWYNPSEYPTGPFIIDVRSATLEMPDFYLAGHIPGAVHIPLPELMQHLDSLPKDRQIVVVSGAGETGGAAAAILNVLGYNATNLMWGMASWTDNETIAPARYDRTRDTVYDWAGAFRTVCPISEPTDTYSFPVVDNTSSNNVQAILEAAANAYLADRSRRFNLAGQELYEALYYELHEQSTVTLFESLYFTDTGTGNPYSVPFFLDVRDEETYLNGHLCGTAHFFWKDVFKPENLQKLPLDRQVLVVSGTGHESAVVYTLLNMMGYNAINLKWGIVGWSLQNLGAPLAPDAFDPQRDVMNHPMVSGYDPFVPKPGP